MSSNYYSTPDANEKLHQLLEATRLNPAFNLDFCNQLTDRSLNANGWNFNNRITPLYHLFFTLHCNGYYYLGSHKERLEDGRIIFVSPGYPYGRELYHKETYTVFPVRFFLTYDIQERYIESPYAMSITTGDIPLFHSLFKKLYSLYRSDNIPLRNEIISLTLSEILHLLSLEISLQSQTLNIDTRISEIKNFIDAKPFEQHSVVELAKRCHVSQKHFIQLFSSAYNMTPKQYILKIKMQHAQLLLSETSLNISSVADLSGYADLFSFSKQYKKIFGVPPSQCKNKFRI